MFFCRHMAVVFCFLAFFCLLKQVQADSQERSIIASYLFNIPIEDIDDATEGANYDYNPWGADPGLYSYYIGGHGGVDIQTKDRYTNDRTFYAVSKGEVIAVGGDYNTIAIYDSDLDQTTLYLHADSISVSVGDTIEVGDALGVQGNTSPDSIGTHVHLEVRSGYQTSAGNGADYSLDPDVYVMPYLQYDADTVVLWDSLTSEEIADDMESIDSDGNLQTGEWARFIITTLSSYNRLVIKITDLTNQTYLYVKDERPTTVETETVMSDTYCVPYTNDASESCAFDTSGDETWYAGVYAVSEGSFTIQAFWFGPGSDSGSDDLSRPDSNDLFSVDSWIDSDGDGLSDEEEVTWGTRNGDTDTDSDDLTDGEEVHTYGTDPLDGDSDDDGLEDGLEIGIGTDPNDTDSDDDGYSDGEEINNGYDPTDTNDPINPSDVDNDNDGYTVDGGDCNDSSASIYPGTTATEFCSDDIDINCDGDSDGDSLLDDNEMGLGTDPYDCDTDGDGLRDGEEVNTYSTNPLDTDSDEDALSDQGEVGTYFTNPNDNDSDDDGLYDGDEVNDGMNPLDTDSDDDSLTDYHEIVTYGTDPNDADSDDDNFSDSEELSKEWDPLDILDPKKRMIPILAGYLTPTDTDVEGVSDSDGDGLNDDVEITEGSDPNDPLSIACITPSTEDWTITSDCTFFSSKTWSGNLYVQSGAVVTIPSGVLLDMDFSQQKLVIQSGSGILIEQGGKIY